MPFVAGGAPGSSPGAPGSSRDPPPEGLCQIPAHPFPPPQKNFQKLCNLKAPFSGPRLAIFMVFVRVFYGSLLRSHYFPSLRTSWCRF